MDNTTSEVKWMRHRFKANAPDYRPIDFPSPGPYWCTGFGGDEDEYAIIVAYLPPDIDVETY